MTPDTFEQTKKALIALGGQRVWSLMVTLFGDLAQSERSTIDGPILSAIMAEVEVKPEAVRVALHRLRNDGWITSQKYGRTRRHALTPSSRAESRQASARIYASPTRTDTQWQLAIMEDTASATRENMIERGFAQLAPRIYLGHPAAKAPKNALTLNGGPVPQWLRQQIAPQMLIAEYNALIPLLRNVEKQIPAGSLDNLQTAVLRCLIVHNWRRILLRHPALPRVLLPDDWPGYTCHVLVDRLLARFPRPSLITIPPA
ncbi:PaaX family transcriptional regulator [Sulfitobacter sp. F26169L]|uniref:PaaX family transcriptional regulator C-terminal domain-containing protein n=1 Tax=Sulfitobacter sp. F26169L TaxID=2996015 RepID=UPI002260E07B|nr:PaaX family transcriptional regulator C-terminal domain-containing protein [Sulfitobacter sp. F26169L]MCX7565961.1 PaaX family transcriptional regulator [Sulfitobacter sp. F26169L]